MATRKSSILIIEDDIATRSLLIDVFADRPDLLVYTAASGAEALSFLKTERPDLALLNLGLSDMNGVDVYLRIRQRAALATMPVMFMSARSNDDIDARIDVLKGPYRRISKPFDLEELTTLMAELLNTGALSAAYE